MGSNITRFIGHFCGTPFDIIDCCNILDNEKRYEEEYKIIWKSIFNREYNHDDLVNYVEDVIDELKRDNHPIYNGDFIEDCSLYQINS